MTSRFFLTDLLHSPMNHHNREVQMLNEQIEKLIEQRDEAQLLLKGAHRMRCGKWITKTNSYYYEDFIQWRDIRDYLVEKGLLKKEECEYNGKDEDEDEE